MYSYLSGLLYMEAIEKKQRYNTQLKQTIFKRHESSVHKIKNCQTIYSRSSNGMLTQIDGSLLHIEHTIPGHSCPGIVVHS